MAITSSSQVLNAQSVKNLTPMLDDVIQYLNYAKESLIEARSKCDTTVLDSNTGNNFPTHIQNFITLIEAQITSVQELKSFVNNSATNIASAEQAELDAYIAEQEAARAEAEAAAAATAATAEAR